MLTISQLAAYAGVTVRAVRHYHAKGLLPEPDRDHSGYRRYDAAAVVELIKIRTLADAGVPLSRVHELLAAGDQEFAAAVEEIDRRLRTEIHELQRHRKRVAQLAAGDSLALPPEAVAYVGRLRGLGVPEEMVDAERDAWILVAAQLPERMALFMQMKEQQLQDPSVVALYRELADVIYWTEDDPRLPNVVDQLIAQMESIPTDAWDDDPLPDDLAVLLDGVFLDSVPVARRMLQLMEARGWTGWTNLKRIEPPREF
ncbi:MerR family transcriptional regulator [Luteipulveratus mongoliensis]|uniref:MerR family transcriptional regulator n=1 Tax=Luteipulveratus mongoliensis TaxID=571913 RepID=A0A0K1JEL7_9MICO|nr:MerR family transcriptional regulator [Luteipulveratus mongoliensis]AKU15146.1 MerR family transcriptional regulator [Luteipulveratus mongoliensis]